MRLQIHIIHLNLSKLKDSVKMRNQFAENLTRRKNMVCVRYIKLKSS